MRSLFSRLIHKYLYDIRLRYKLLISNGLLILVPTLVLSFFLYSRLYSAVISDTILSEQTLLGQTTNSIESTLNQIKDTSDTLLASKNAGRLFSEYGRLYSKNARHESVEGLIEEADELMNDPLISDIHIYLGDSWSYLLEEDPEETIFSPLSRVSSSYWYGIFSSSDITSLLCPSLYLTVTEEDTRGELAYIQPLNKDGQEAGYAAVYFSQDQLDAVLGTNISTQDSATYIINERDFVVSSSDPTLSGAYYMSNEVLGELVGGVNMYTTRPYLDDSIYVGYFSILDTDWHLVSILSSASLLQKGQSLVFSFVGLYLVFFVLVLLFSIYLSRSISRRIGTLSDKMQSVHQGRPEKLESGENAQDEIGSLVDTYNYMSDEINQLLDDQHKAAEELKMEEFKALQSQINPHFLYNSLDMINWLSRSGREEDVTRAIQALSRFYKLTLSKKDTNGTIGEELEHASLYVELQNMRFENRISFVVDIPDTFMDYGIPKLTFQPIVENCILHGIMEKPEKSGTILITGWLEGDDLVIQISDDGVGMSAEQTASLLDGSVRESGSGSNIGIYNTHSRLQVLYGEHYGLSYESEPGKGTDTQIRIPAVRAASEDSPVPQESES